MIDAGADQTMKRKTAVLSVGFLERHENVGAIAEAFSEAIWIGEPSRAQGWIRPFSLERYLPARCPELASGLKSS